MSKFDIIVGFIELAQQALKSAQEVRDAAKRNRELTDAEIEELDRRIAEAAKSEAWKPRR